MEQGLLRGFPQIFQAVFRCAPSTPDTRKTPFVCSGASQSRRTNMIIHAPNCKLFKRTQQNFHVRKMDGEAFIVREDEEDTNSYEMD